MPFTDDRRSGGRFCFKRLGNSYVIVGGGGLEVQVIAFPFRKSYLNILS